MKIYVVYSLLLVSTMFTIDASSPADLYHPLLDQSKSDQSVLKSYHTLASPEDVLVHFDEKHVEEKVKKHLIPLAKIILHQPVLQNKLKAAQPLLREAYIAPLVETMQERHIKELSKILIERHDSTGFFKSPEKLNACADQLSKYAQAASLEKRKNETANSQELLSHVEQLMKDRSLIDAVTLDKKYEMLWAKYYIRLDEEWRNVQSACAAFAGVKEKLKCEVHKKRAYDIMREVLIQDDPGTSALKNIELFDQLFEANYLVFERHKTK